MISEKYFKLNYSTVIKEIGHWKQMDVPNKYWEITNNFETINYHSFQEKAPNLKNFELNKKAKLTDFLSTIQLDISKGMFVSSKTKEIIEKHNAFGVKFYNTSILMNKNEDINNYFFMHVIDNYGELLNINKSKFIDFLEDDKEVKLDLNEPISGSIAPKRLTLNNPYDLFRSPGGVEIIISESLKNSFTKANITGSFIEELTDYKVYID
ncbi:DUF1629 domain-containing protein [Dokdonia sp.]|uniref:imm11 family protein n=1 Tax=Dokdonia sp. TaxID=2024995 RepID=UPI0032654618